MEPPRTKAGRSTGVARGATVSFSADVSTDGVGEVSIDAAAVCEATDNEPRRGCNSSVVERGLALPEGSSKGLLAERLDLESIASESDGSGGNGGNGLRGA
jgi:hypothetical protein